MSSEEIATFVAITGVEDEAVAVQFLEMSGGDLDTAVSLYFEHGASAATDPAPSSNTGTGDEDLASRLQSEAYQENQDDGVRAPIQSTVQRLVDDAPYYSEPSRHSTQTPEQMFASSGPSTVFNQTFGFHSSAGGSNPFVSAVRGASTYDDDVEDEDDDGDVVVDDGNDGDVYSDEELVQGTDSEGDITYTRRRVLRRRSRGSNSRGVSSQTAHQRRLAQLFSPPWDIISKYDLNMAKSVGRELKKWIIVNVQDNSEFRCQQLNRDLWSKKEVKDIVKENFVFLQYPHDSPVGQEYRSYYPFSDYPHIAILDPKTGERVKMWSDVPDPVEFVEALVNFLDRFSLDPGHVNPIVQHKRKIDPDSLTEEQQMELAIKKSLGAHVEEEDGVVENGHNNDNPIVLDSDEEYSGFEEISDDEEASEDEIDEVEVVEAPAAPIAPEPAPQEENLEDLTEEEVLATILPKPHTEPENDPSTTTRVQIRSGDGSRLVHRFNKTDTVKDIYAYIKHDFDSVQGGKFFTLMSQRTNLIRKVNESLQEAGLLNASILLEVES